MIIVHDDLLALFVLVPWMAAIVVSALARAPFPWLAPLLAASAGAGTCGLAVHFARLIFERGGFRYVDVQGWVGARVEGMGPWGVPDVVLMPAGTPILVAAQISGFLAVLLLGPHALKQRAVGALSAVLVGLGSVSLIVLARRTEVAAAACVAAGLAGTWLLMASSPRRVDVEAAARVFLLHRVGDALVFLGIVVLAGAAGLGAVEELPATAPLIEPWARAASGPLEGFAPREVWMLVGFLVVAGYATRLASGPFLPLVGDATATLGPAIGFAHGVCFLGAGLVALGRLTPMLWLAPEALQVLGWLASLATIGSAAGALVVRDARRIDVSLLSGFAAIASVCIAATDIHMSVLATGLVLLGSVPLCATSGAVIEATGRDDPFTLGGLEHRMPRTHTVRLLTTGALFGPLFSGAFVAASALHGAARAPWLGHLLVGVLAFGIGLLTLAAFRPIHLVFTGPRPRETLERAVGDPPWWSALPPLFVALPLLGLGLVQIPDGVIDALPMELTYQPPLASLVMPEQQQLEALRTHVLAPWQTPAANPLVWLAIAVGASALGWAASTILYRGGPGRVFRALLTGTHVQRGLRLLSRVADSEGHVARDVGESAVRLSRLFASRLAPEILDTILRRIPSVIAIVLGALVRFVADGSAQRGIATALLALVGLLVWWGAG